MEGGWTSLLGFVIHGRFIPVGIVAVGFVAAIDCGRAGNVGSGFPERGGFLGSAFCCFFHGLFVLSFQVLEGLGLG